MRKTHQELIDAVYGALMLLLVVLIIFVAMQSCADAQNIEGQPIASQYSTWQVAGFAPDTYNFVPTSCRVQGGASFFPAFAVGTPVKIVDGNPNLTEIVTPTNVVINNTTCSIAIAPVNHHNLPFYLTSATGGLQEAINANVTSPAINTIILDSRFYVSVGPSNVATVINDALGYSNLGLVDITQTPYVWYQWNGSHYVVTSTGNDVLSVFGRTGHVVAEAGDYNCDQVTNCGVAPNIAFNSPLSAAISSTDTTIPLSASTSGLTVPGYVVMPGGEWIKYTGTFGNNLTGAIRGAHQTTAAAYASGTYAYSVLSDLGNPAQAPQSYIVSDNGSIPSITVLNCSVPDFTANLSVQINCSSNETFVDSGGRIFQTNGIYENKLESPTGIGPGGGEAPIADSGYLFDSTRQNQSTVLQGFGPGLAGPVSSVQPATIAAPTIHNFANTGSTTWSYECTGTDVDGNTYPGTVASITNGPATITSGEMIVTCPFSAGAASETLWRTAGGPVSPTLVNSGPQPWSSEDVGVEGTPGAPPSTNSSIPKVCVGAGEASCWTASGGGNVFNLGQIAPYFIAASDGVHAGYSSLIGNTKAPAVVSNTAGFMGPDSASFAAYALQLPSANPSGGQELSFATPSSGVSVGSWVNGTQTICSGTVALGTSPIASGAAATTVTATCTGLATTDVMVLSFNGSPLAVTGYIPSASGMLTIMGWPTANTINVAVVNNTASSITPGAITLNYRVTR